MATLQQHVKINDGRGRYRLFHKQRVPWCNFEFGEALEKATFLKPEHKGLAILLWLTGLRISEALELKKEQFMKDGDSLSIDTGVRKKKKKFSKSGKLLVHEPPEPMLIPLETYGIDTLLWCVENTKDGEPVFPYCTKTGYNIIRRAFHTYPHFFRLCRVSIILDEEGFSGVKGWTTLTAEAIDPYTGRKKLRALSRKMFGGFIRS